MTRECLRFCQAPEHSPNCGCVGCKRTSETCRTATDDHFTPQCIERVARIKDTKENHQWLSRPCHDIKDADTPLRKAVLANETVLFDGLTGGQAFELHRSIFEAGQLPEWLSEHKRQVRNTRHQRRRFKHHRR